MKTLVKIPRILLEEALRDLHRPHPFGAERQGFFSLRQSLDPDLSLVLCHEYHSIPDELYVQDDSCGGRIGGEAIRSAMGRAFRTGSGQLWVHTHGRAGTPMASSTDIHEGPRVIRSCANAQPKALHGWAVISEDGITGQIANLSGRLSELSQLSVVGWPLKTPGHLPLHTKSIDDDQFSRQSFLGPRSQDTIESALIGIVGLGGGGSHINQQLAHMGFQRFILCDSDRIEKSNLHRLVGATRADILKKRHKTAIASRVIRSLQPKAKIDDAPKNWEDKKHILRSCDIIFAALDGFVGRRDLEAFCRRHMIPLIDIGMKVIRSDDSPPEIHGQVILSMPAEPCMHCIRFLTEEVLAKEAGGYGAGPQPQVIWSNGVLASSAVGHAIALLTGWPQTSRPSCRIDYRGSELTLSPSNLVSAMTKRTCSHYPLPQMGDPVFRPL